MYIDIFGQIPLEKPLSENQQRDDLMLASEVTPGLLAGAEPNAHQFYVTIVLMGDQMGRDSGRYRSNSGTRSGM
jgi:hypothetical protein